MPAILMGISVWPVFDRPFAGSAPNTDGKLLFWSLPALDQLAQREGVRPLSSFTDLREPPPAWDGDLDTLEEAIGPWEEWFPPDDGRTTIAALIAALRGALPSDMTRAAADEIVSDLKELDRCLVEACLNGARWRLEVYE